MMIKQSNGLPEARTIVFSPKKISFFFFTFNYSFIMSTTSQPFTNGYALLIGVGNYLHTNPLPVTVNDATILYKLLTDPERAGYPESQVRLLVNDAASRQGIVDGMNWLAERTKSDPQATAMLYFSGHGGIKNDQYLLIPFDFNWSNWEDLSISKELFAEKVAAIDTRKLMVFLDCCHAAGVATKASIENNFTPSNEALYKELRKGTGKLVVASCRANQLSYIYPGAAYSAFTDALISAFDGLADNGRGYATALRTMTSVSEEVRKVSKDKQTPVFDLEKVEDFAICRTNKGLSTRLPFKKTMAYLGESYLEQAGPADAGAHLREFKKELITQLDDKGFAAIPEVLEVIHGSQLEYDKPAFANLRRDGTSPLALLTPNDYIIRLKIFIGTINS